MSTQAIATFGVYRRPSNDELAVLELANDFRQAVCHINQQQHNETILIRDKLFPGLFAAMVNSEHIYAEICDLEKQIKAHHSEVRDRNAVTEDQESRLESLRADRAAAVKLIVAEKKPWLAMLKEFRQSFRSAADWKNVNSLAKRRMAYAALKWPDHLADYAEMWLRLDLARRDIGREFQDRGLLSSIRTEIIEASQPKLGKDKPGIRYRFGRQPDPRPWEKLTLQIPGGVTMQQAIDGECHGLRLKPAYTNHTAAGPVTVYECRQQIGTAGHPRVIIYTLKIHRDFPLSARIQRWTLVVRGAKRFAIPILTDMDFSKPSGKGLLAYDLTWTVRSEGVQVCLFTGEHVNERLVLPNWLIEKRMSVSAAQVRSDNAANALLELRGININKQPGPGELHGIAALEDYCAANLSDHAAANTLDHHRHLLAVAQRNARQAVGCIEKIYETVAARVCRLHSEISVDPINLAKLKKYKKRNLLQEDPIPKPSREIMHAVAPGKLSALLKNYGLASGEVAKDFQGASRTTDLFTTWIGQLGVKTGTKPNAERHRSQSDVKELVAT